MNLIREKKHRLEKEFYIGVKTVSFTACIKKEEKVFTNNFIFSIFRDKLIESIKKYGCEALIYLFMPDHLHLILKGKNNDSNVIKAIDLFKQKTGYWFSQNMLYSKWQKDYYDHILRDNEDLRSHIYYILNNPVRAGIVSNWKDYEFKGSTVFDFDKWDLNQ
ncbi:MAG TPA: transposase [Ignavibacteria bacterium]|nr:transposase [Ignavibacteria bacterium]HQY51438.1 transposase [Ignavibacteria bacterium]HRA99233.1 transposase [Ignavibacteria bacterium]